MCLFINIIIHWKYLNKQAALYVKIDFIYDLNFHIFIDFINKDDFFPFQLIW